MRPALVALALLLAACSETTSSSVDEAKAEQMVIDTYGPCFAAPGFPSADEATLREAMLVRTARATDDGWVPVQVFLQNTATGQESEPTFRVNPTTGETAPQHGDADAQAVLAKCP